LADTGILIPLRLTAPQAKLLQGMAERGGEFSWNWSNCRPDVAAMARELISKGLVTDMQAERRLRLTDQGRSAVSQIDHQTRNARIIQA